MHLFWIRYILPLIMAAMPRRIIEVGAEFGWNTERLMNYCRAHGAHLDVVDPAPHPVFFEVLAKFGPEYTYFPLKSLDAIPLMQPADFVLLDGDHNYFTVYNELASIFVRAAELAEAPPIVLLHDMCWPYARRDMYYDPTAINPDDRQPYAKRGIVPGQSELADIGVNGHFANALHEGGPRNGVRTGVEDFVAATPHQVTLHLLPFFNGMGILVPEARRTPAIDAVIESFFAGPAMLAAAEELESQIQHLRADLEHHKIVLTERNEALMRARAELAAVRTRPPE